MVPALARTIRFQLLGALLLLFGLFAGALGYAVYSAEQMARQQTVVRAAARLEPVIGALERQSLHYLSTPARDYPTYYRDLKLYWQDLQAQIRTFDRTFACFRTGRFEPAVTGREEALIVDWDDQRATAAIRRVADVWQGFRQGLNEALGDDRDEPRLEYAAEYVLGNVEGLRRATRRLYERFEATARAHRARVASVQRASVGVALVLMVAVLAWLHLRVLRPLREAVAGFKRVAQGEFGHQLPIGARNEIGVLSRAFNVLSARLHALLRLIDNIQKSEALDVTLAGSFDDLRKFFPLDWVGVLTRGTDATQLVLEHARTASGPDTLGQTTFVLDPKGDIAAALREDPPVRIPDLTLGHDREIPGTLEHVLADRGLQAAMALGIRRGNGAAGLIVFASSRPHAYLTEHQELLANIGPLLSHSLDTRLGRLTDRGDRA